MKPLADAEVSKQYRCDERWYDWFSIPNYHLGNGYVNPDPDNPGTCYTPCQAGTIPAYQTDPVDGQNLHFISNEDNTGQCVSRADYFGGKYSSGSDYCPLSWIYILNSTSTSLKDLVNTNNNNFANSEIAKDVLTSAFSGNQNKSQIYANNIHKSLPIELNNIALPLQAMQAACNRIETPERVLPAYNMCSNLMINEKKIYENFTKSMPTDMAKNKVTMMKQACNAVFCNLRDPANDLINKNPLCFKNVGTFDPSTGEIIDQNNLPRPIAPTPIPQQSFMRSSIMFAVYLVLFPLLAFIIYIFFTDALLPYVLIPLYYKFLELIRFLPKGYCDNYMQLRDSRLKLNALEKKCMDAKEAFKLKNKTLKDAGQPIIDEKTVPFTDCDKLPSQQTEHEDLIKKMQHAIDKKQIPQVPAPPTIP
jgi:hypothetical protein